MEKLIITCAISGAEVTKEDNKYVPYTVEEMANEAYNAYSAGASIIHLHVRTDEGTPTQNVKRFDESINAILENDNCYEAKAVLVTINEEPVVALKTIEEADQVIENAKMVHLFIEQYK